MDYLWQKITEWLKEVLISGICSNLTGLFDATNEKVAEIAGQIGCTSARAVGGAVGKNPISLIIPCHRVLGADGSLTGYAGGTDRKKMLLEWEHRSRE